MKKYIVSFAEHQESDGLGSSVSNVFESKEEAYNRLKEEYDYLIDNINKSKETYEFYENELTDDSYYIEVSNIYGWEYYESHIVEIEV